MNRVTGAQIEKILFLLAMAVLGGCQDSAITTSTPDAAIAQPLGPAPDFDLEDVSGITIRSTDLKGKVSIIDFWATWCEPCKSEIPKYNALHEAYKDKDVQVLGITVESPRNGIAPKVKEWGIKYAVVVGDSKVSEGFGGYIGLPTTFIVGKDWKIYKKYLGAIPGKEEKIKKDIETLLNSQSNL